MRTLMLGAIVGLAYPAGAGAESGPARVPLQPYLGRLLTVSALLGREKVTLLFDTGGGQTLITPRVASRIGCTPRGRSVGLRMSGERVEFQQCEAPALLIGGRRLAGSQIAVWDVMAVLPKEVPQLDGVLALDSLVDQPFTLDLSARTLTLESERSLERQVATMSRLRARVATGLSGADLTVFVRGALDRPGWFLFDSANLDVVLAARHMLEHGPTPASPSSVAPLSLDGLPTREVPVSVRDIVHDGALSEEYLRQWTWTFRLASGELWAAPAR